MIRAEVFRKTLPVDRWLEHPAQPCAVNYATVDAKANDAPGKLVHHHQNPMRTQGCGLASEPIAAPQAVLHMAEKAEPRGTSGIRFWPVMSAQDTANYVLVYFHPEGQRDLLSDSGTAPVGIPPLHFHHGVDEFFRRSLGTRTTAGFWRKQRRYFRLVSSLCRCSSVEGLRTMAERKTRARRMKSMHPPAIIRSAELRLGARLRLRFRIRS